MLALEVFTTTNVISPMNSLYVVNSFSYHMETSAHVSQLRNLIQPLLVILKDDGVDMKAKPVLPHMDHHAHRSCYETQLSESVYVSAISSLSACQQPTGRAEMHCSPGHLLCITFPSAPPRLDVVSLSLLFLPEWVKRLPGYSWCCSWAFILDHLPERITFYSSTCDLNSHVANMHFHTKRVTAHCIV